ncbi:transmembrane protein 128 isoform X3 [Narcine bancroftii]|uniref:transmembrane protein 128 isoform X3 n=1 Tax=Narcine bancroftii TaxID=1343680 RepID=UPI003831AE7B
MAADAEALLRVRNRFRQDAQAVFTGDALRSTADLEDEVKKKEKPLPRFNIHSVFWILSSIAVTYYVDFFSTIKTDYRIEGRWFLLGSSLLIISLLIAIYCIFYLEWYRGVREYEQYNPTLVPSATAAFVAATVCPPTTVVTLMVQNSILDPTINDMAHRTQSR